MLSSGATTGTAFTNNAGANAITTPNGRFLVFTNNVGDVSAGGLSANPFYGQSFSGFRRHRRCLTRMRAIASSMRKVRR